MIKLEFEETQEKKSDIAFENIKKIAPYHDLNLVLNACMGWFKTNPHLKTTDLEKKLRDEKIDIHIISAENKIDETKYKSILPFDMEKECSRMMIFSCRPEKEGLEELLTHAKTYEENFNRLNECGLICPKELGNKSSKNFFDDSNQMDKNTPIGKLRSVWGKVKIIEEKLEDVFNSCSNFIKEKYKVEPELKVYGIAKDGSAISVLIHNKNIVCPIGVMISYNKEGEKLMKYVNIYDKSPDAFTGFIK